MVNLQITERMDADQLKKILENHRKWVLDEGGGSRADLSGADLYGANLSGASLSGADLYGANPSGANLSRANLSGANLSRADLSGADLYGANLSGANLSRANLYGANLSGADLSGANLSGADLYGANLSRANLSGANLSGASLSGADLYGANLSRADLSRADLYGANLSRANLSGANLSKTKNAMLAFAITEILPMEGEVIGWKKCRGNVLVKVRIPPTARRSNATGRKCRAEFVEVLDVIGADVGIGIYDGKTEYIKGQTVHCHEWCTDRFKECAGGIHFFLTKEEAEAYE